MSALLIMLLLFPASSARASDPALGKPHEFIAAWRRADFRGLYGYLSDAHQKHWLSFSQFQSFLGEAPAKILKETIDSQKDGIHYSCRYIDSEFAMNLDLWFDSNLKVAALKLVSADFPYTPAHEQEIAPYRFRFPFDSATGPWTLTGEHHVAARSQRFAYDMTLIKNGRSYKGDKRANASYFAYGQEIHSPASGTVIEIENNEPEVAPGEANAAARGNYVLIEVQKGLYLYATHLIPGSLSVKPGQEITEGQLLGKVGNSGHSTEPHLHIEIFDSLPRAKADAFPFYFYNVIHNSRPAAQALARYGDTMSAVTLP